MFFSLALVLSSLSITYGSTTVPINPSSVPSGIYAVTSYLYDTDIVQISIYNYTDYHSQIDYLRVYAQKTESELTYKPIIAQCNMSSVQYDHYDGCNFGYGYYGGNNNLACRFVLTENSETYRTNWLSQWRYDNFYDGFNVDGDGLNDAQIHSLTIYIRSNFQDEDEFRTISGALDGSSYTDGYNDGRADGEEIGEAKGYDNGYDNGYDEGYGVGYQEGLVDGYDNADMSFIFSGIVQVGMLPVNFFLSILNWEVFGINIGGFVQGLLSLALIIIIVRTVIGNFGGSGDK